MLQKQTRRWKLPCAVSLHILLCPGLSSCYGCTHNPHQLCKRTFSLRVCVWIPVSTLHCPGERSSLSLYPGPCWYLSANLVVGLCHPPEVSWPPSVVSLLPPTKWVRGSGSLLYWMSAVLPKWSRWKKTKNKQTKNPRHHSFFLFCSWVRLFPWMLQSCFGYFRA